MAGLLSFGFCAPNMLNYFGIIKTCFSFSSFFEQLSMERHTCWRRGRNSRAVAKQRQGPAKAGGWPWEAEAAAKGKRARGCLPDHVSSTWAAWSWETEPPAPLWDVGRHRTTSVTQRRPLAGSQRVFQTSSWKRLNEPKWPPSTWGAADNCVLPHRQHRCFPRSASLDWGESFTHTFVLAVRSTSVF